MTSRRLRRTIAIITFSPTQIIDNPSVQPCAPKKCVDTTRTKKQSELLPGCLSVRLNLLRWFQLL